MTTIQTIHTYRAILEHAELDTKQANHVASPWAALAERVKNVRQLPQVLLGGFCPGRAEMDFERSRDPKLADVATGYDDVGGELFAKRGPRLADVNQGQLGDCFLLAGHRHRRCR